MFNRRLVIIFILIAMIAGVLIARLGQLQIGQAEHWKGEAKVFVNRHLIMDTPRGAILDRNGVVMAEDQPSWDLAIDYRAMNYDDRWMTQEAVRRMKKAGIAERKERLRKLPEYKRQIADQIDEIPQVIGEACGLPVEEVKARMDNIRAKIHALRQDIWSRRYDRETDSQTIASGLFEAETDETLKDERVAHTLVAAIPDTIRNEFEKRLNDYPGLVIIDSKRRAYPCGDVAAQVIGTMRPVDKETMKRQPFERPDLIEGDDPGNLGGYLSGDQMGASGVERLAEERLRGKRGVRLMQLDGREVSEKRQLPVAGKEVRLTLDVRLQAAIQRALYEPGSTLRQGEDGQDHNVALVVMAMDGQILTMLSTPTYDLNEYEKNIVQLNGDRANRPLVNRTLAAAYPPGSIIKPFVAAAALTDGVISPTETVFCRGYLYPNMPRAYRCSIYTDHGVGHSNVNVVGALEQSCNIYFYTMGMKLGLGRLTQWYGDFGFGSLTGIGLREEVDGQIPNTQRVVDESRAKSDAIFLGIGQGQIVVTPLQMANGYATLLRGGVMVPPRIVLDQAVGTPVQKCQVSAGNLALVRQGMELVTHGEHGTARAMLKRVRANLAGKTGSATDSQPAFDANGQPVWDTTKPVLDRQGREVKGADGQPTYHQLKVDGTHAWFVGYVPADNPQYVIVSLVEFGGHGGSAATPLVKRAVLEMEKLGYLPAVD